MFAPKTFQSSHRPSTVDAASLGNRWGISAAQEAALTLKATTQKYVRSALLPLARRYRVDRMFGQKMFNALEWTLGWLVSSFSQWSLRLRHDICYGWNPCPQCYYCDWSL